MKAKNVFGVMLMCVLVATAGSQAQGEMGVGWIKGKVVEEGTDKPIAGAEVICSVDSKTRRGVVTDAEGNFRTTTQFAGTIILINVKAEGYYYSLFPEEVIVGKGETEILIELINQKKYNEEIERERMKTIKTPKTFKIEYRDAMEIFSLVKSISCARSASRELQTITALGNEEELANLQELINKYDTPLKQVWLEVLLIMASGNGGGKPDYPEEINNIVSNLKSLFKFGKYRIIGRGNAMGLEGSTLSFSGRIEYDTEALLQHPFTVRTGLGAAGDVVKLQNLQVMVKNPENQIQTSINVKNGETVILGASRGTSSENALITVVTAKIMK